MKVIYFVTEGKTDQIVLEELVASLTGGQDFIPRHIQPPSSDFAEEVYENLSGGWKGVKSWCAGERPSGPLGRDEVTKLADCLIIHVDGDVVTDPEFRDPPLEHPLPNSQTVSDWIREHLISILPKEGLGKVVFCVPVQDLEAWIVCCLHPDVADQFSPIEERRAPGELLVQRLPHKLIRAKDGGLKKIVARYTASAPAIARGWPQAAHSRGELPARCLQAARFEEELRAILIG